MPPLNGSSAPALEDQPSSSGPLLRVVHAGKYGPGIAGHNGMEAITERVPFPERLRREMVRQGHVWKGRPSVRSAAAAWGYYRGTVASWLKGNSEPTVSEWEAIVILGRAKEVSR